MRCVFCQLWQISGGADLLQGPSRGRGMGRAVSPEEFAAICLDLQSRGARNINVVTGSHAIPAILRGLTAARAAGLSLPVLWNSSGYESPEALELLDGHVDTFMPDLKTLDGSLSAKYNNARDYPEVATRAILRMCETRPGRVVVRHLILPGHPESTRRVLRWFADNIAGRALISVMCQYTPVGKGPKRFISRREYETVLGWLDEFGIEEGFCQELIPSTDRIPDFRLPSPFGPELSEPVWHCGG